MTTITPAVLKVINRAKQLLFTDAHDIAHDINHHYRVWEHCMNIIMEENLVNDIDLESLYIAAWWHDYKRGSKEYVELITELKNNDFSSLEINYTIGIMNSHSFGDAGQNTLEAKILYDADKIEYISTARWEMINLSIQFEAFPEGRVLEYYHGINERLSTVKERLYFEYSRKVFVENLRNLISYLKSGLVASIIVKNLDLGHLEKLRDQV